jgi:PAS domain S-box-containing protein
MASSDQNQLPATLELYGRAMASASCGIAIADMTQPDHPLIYCNQAFEVITGYSRQDVLGRNCRFMQGEGTDPAMVDQLRQAIRQGESCEVVLLNYRKDGRPFWNSLSISPVHDTSGRLTHYIGVQTDVTEAVEARQRASRQLQEEQLLNGVTQRIRQALDLNTVLSTTVNEVRHLLQTDRVVVYRFEPDWTGLVVAESVGEQWMPSLNVVIEDTCFCQNRARDYHQGRISAIDNIETAPPQRLPSQPAAPVSGASQPGAADRRQRQTVGPVDCSSLPRAAPMAAWGSQAVGAIGQPTGGGRDASGAVRTGPTGN